MKHSPYLVCLFIVSISILASDSWSTILDSKHNLSLSGPGTIKSTTEEEVCVFCHAPHRARLNTPYLWNRDENQSGFTPYDSTTMYATVGQPSGASMLCLSCHDGTIALGSVLSRTAEIPFAGGIRFIPDGDKKLGTIISDDHPVSFVYDDNLASANGELVFPSTLTGDVKMDQLGLLQCTSCHDPHDDVYGNFLIKPNNFSDLCNTCHNRTDWPTSSHATSAAIWNGAGSDPWPHTTYTTVDENACESCHRPHTAGGHEGLLNHLIEEDNCLVCHNANVATKDIESELIKTYRHPVQDYVGIHDPAEDFTGGLVSDHVECVDCHNPHRVDNATANAPDVSGKTRGVKGITASGSQTNESLYLYEVCFKCHADNNVVSFAAITRQNQQLNTRLEFDVGNPSYHPVEGIGQNPNVPSLLPPYTSNSIIYCTDCHNSNDSPANGGVGPNGPHGSTNQYLLERNYTTVDGTNESTFEYAMCYKCHDRDSLRADDSGFPHSRHVENNDVPCSVCHDAHGVSSTQGNSINNSHLINFDMNVVSPDASARLFFDDRGTFAGACYLNCHTIEHQPDSGTGVYP